MEANKMKITGFAEIDLPFFESLGRGYMGKNYSIYHLKSASMFIEKVRSIENDYATGVSITEAAVEEHRTSVVAGIFFISAALEATINEIIFSISSDTYDNEEDNKKLNLFIETVKFIKKEKRLQKILKDCNVLDKYQCVLKALEKELFKKSRYPYQDADNILCLRNALIHYKIDDKNEHEKIQQRMEGKIKKYGKNPFVSDAASFFPYKCLGYGCLKYFSDTFVSFVTEFHDKIGLSWMAEQQKDILAKKIMI